MRVTEHVWWNTARNILSEWKMTVSNSFQILKGWLKKRKFDIFQNLRSPQKDGLQQEGSFISLVISPSFPSFSFIQNKTQS